MFAQELFDVLGSFQVFQFGVFSDFSDRINTISCAILLVLSALILAKQYLFNSISCYVPITPGGEQFTDYLADFCWVHGTIPIRPDESLPDDPVTWDGMDRTRRINYYQWVPFMLGLHCIFFYIPHIAWQAICAQRTGGDLFALVQSAANAATESREKRHDCVIQVANFLQDMIQEHSYKSSGRTARLKRRAYKKMGICVASKHLGTCLVFSYLCIKLLTIVNAIVQIVLIQRFLGFYEGGSHGPDSMKLNDKNSEYGYTDTTGFWFGAQVAYYIISGKDWPETLLFPRVAYCRVPGIRIVGGENAYTAQCALPINMLNEKIYIFLWFWIFFVILVSVVSLVLWIIRLATAPSRGGFIKRFLRVRKVPSPQNKPWINADDVEEFVDDYLRRDGVFLIRMMAINAGDVITSEIVEHLYTEFVKNWVEIEHDEDEDMRLSKSLAADV